MTELRRPLVRTWEISVLNVSLRREPMFASVVLVITAMKNKIKHDIYGKCRDGQSNVERNLKKCGIFHKEYCVLIRLCYDCQAITNLLGMKSNVFVLYK